MSNIDKIAKINLENKPYVKPVSNVDIGFYNLDNGTAKLQFSITRDGFPMQMGPVNVTGYLWLKSTNGTMSGQLDLEIIDGLNGIVGVTIPNWFLVGSTDTDVKGQIILAVNENTDIATLGEFGFRVKDALPNQIKGEIKVQYFRMFDDMRLALENKVEDIETRLGDLDLLITNVETIVSNGISQVNKTVKNAETTLIDIKAKAETNINDTVKSVIDDVNTTKDNVISTMNNKVEESVSNIGNISNTAIEHVDGKLEEFNQAIADNEFVKPEVLQQTIDNLDWQRYRTTNADGTIRNVVGINLSDNNVLDNLKPGLFYSSSTEGQPTGASSKHGLVNVIEREDKGYKKIIFMPYNSAQSFQKYKLNEWTNWQQIGVPTDTGWIPFQLINGALSNTAYKNSGDSGFDCAYKTITNGNVLTKKVRVNATQVSANQVLAQLPSNFAKTTQRFLVGNSAFIVIKPNGEVNLRVSGDTSNWDINNEIYTELTWHD